MKTDELDSSKCTTSAFSEDHIKRMKRHAREWEKIFVVTYLKKENYIEHRKNSQNQEQKKKKKKRKEKKKPQSVQLENGQKVQ